MILSANAIDHALLMLAGYTAGVPVAPISVAYSLQSQDFAKLKHIAELLAPGLIYVADTAPFAKALAALGAQAPRSSRAATAQTSARRCSTISRAPPVGPAVEQAAAATRRRHDREIPVHLGLDRPAQGRDQHPRHADREPAAGSCRCWPFLAEQPLTLVDWLPWNHTFGGNHNFNMVLRHAGTLVIDGGRPLPAMVGETVRNLTEISPTIYFNVPAGYAALLPHLERDEAFARSFFAQAAADLLRRRRAAAGPVGAARGRLGARDRPPHADVVVLGHDRDRAARDRRAFPARPRRQCRRAGARASR